MCSIFFCSATVPFQKILAKTQVLSPSTALTIDLRQIALQQNLLLPTTFIFAAYADHCNYLPFITNVQSTAVLPGPLLVTDVAFILLPARQVDVSFHGFLEMALLLVMRCTYKAVSALCGPRLDEGNTGHSFSPNYCAHWHKGAWFKMNN